MVKGKFNEELEKLDDDFLLKAYKELVVLADTGTFPTDGKYFKNLVDLRHKLYADGRNMDATKKDLFDEIARRWCLDKEHLNKEGDSV